MFKKQSGVCENNRVDQNLLLWQVHCKLKTLHTKGAVVWALSRPVVCVRGIRVNCFHCRNKETARDRKRYGCSQLANW